MKALEQISPKDLAGAVKELNESGLMGEGTKIRVVGVAKGTTIEVFTKEFEKILDNPAQGDAALSDACPKAVTFYNELYAEEDPNAVAATEAAPATTEATADTATEATADTATEAAPTEAQPTEPAAGATEPKKRGRPKKDAAPKEPKPPKEKKKRAPPAPLDIPRSRYGHVDKTQAQKLDDAYFNGASHVKAAELAGVNESRARRHLQHLIKDLGATVKEMNLAEDGKDVVGFKVVEETLKKTPKPKAEPEPTVTEAAPAA